MSLLAWLLAAVLLFWVIGAYNRLIAMRNELAQAWARLQSALDQRGAALQPLVACLRAPMSAEAGALDAWAAAHAQSSLAATEMTRRPVNEAHAAAWVAAEAALASAASRALALLDQHSELAQQEPVATLAASWRAGHEQLPYARQAFNDLAKTYNDAVQQFPTRWVARSFSLESAGLI